MSNGLRTPPVTGWPWGVAEHAIPSVQSHYRTFIPTTICSAPVPRIGTLILADLGRLPLHRGDRFSRSVQEPDPASRRLHAGCRSGSLQANPRAYSGSSTYLGFRHHLWHFNTSSAVRFRSPLRTIPDGISSRLLLQRSPQPLRSQLAVV